MNARFPRVCCILAAALKVLPQPLLTHRHRCDKQLLTPLDAPFLPVQRAFRPWRRPAAGLHSPSPATRSCYGTFTFRFTARHSPAASLPGARPGARGGCASRKPGQGGAHVVGCGQRPSTRPVTRRGRPAQALRLGKCQAVQQLRGLQGGVLASLAAASAAGLWPVLVSRRTAAMQGWSC